MEEVLKKTMTEVSRLLAEAAEECRTQNQKAEHIKEALDACGFPLTTSYHEVVKRIQSVLVEYKKSGEEKSAATAFYKMRYEALSECVSRIESMLMHHGIHLNPEHLGVLERTLEEVLESRSKWKSEAEAWESKAKRFDSLHEVVKKELKDARERMHFLQGEVAESLARIRELDNQRKVDKELLEAAERRAGKARREGYALAAVDIIDKLPGLHASLSSDPVGEPYIHIIDENKNVVRSRPYAKE